MAIRNRDRFDSVILGIVTGSSSLGPPRPRHMHATREVTVGRQATRSFAGESLASDQLQLDVYWPDERRPDAYLLPHDCRLRSTARSKSYALTATWTYPTDPTDQTHPTYYSAPAQPTYQTHQAHQAHPTHQTPFFRLSSASPQPPTPTPPSRFRPLGQGVPMVIKWIIVAALAVVAVVGGVVGWHFRVLRRAVRVDRGTLSPQAGAWRHRRRSRRRDWRGRRVDGGRHGACAGLRRCALRNRNLSRASRRHHAPQCAAGTSHLRVVEAAPTSTNLPDACCDAVYMRAVFHHIQDPAALAASVAASLIPRGRVAIIDFPPGALWFHGNDHGVTPEAVTRAFEGAGLTLVHRIGDWGGGMFLLAFERK